MVAVVVAMVYSWPSRTLVLRNRHYHMLVAATEEEQHRGLGDRDSLARNEGMLFVFEEPAVQCFWMKDMHFALDIIWLDAQKKVVYIEKNVSPDTFPKSYCPAEPAEYVIELNAGEVTRNHLAVGQRLSF